jgi:hypothetical protein
MRDFEKNARRYPTGLTDQEWALSVPFLPPVAARGRKPATDVRDVQGAIRHLARTGGSWRRLPKRSSTMANRLLVIPPVRASPAFPHHPRRGADAES